MMYFLLVLLGSGWLLGLTNGQGFSSNRVLGELQSPSNQFRRQNTQPDIFQQNSQIQPFQQQVFSTQQHQRVDSQQSKFRQQSNSGIRFPQAPFPSQQTQFRPTSQTNFASNLIQQPQHQQNSNQFQRSLQNQLQIHQGQFQQPIIQNEQDLHAQNFLTLRNYDQQILGAQSSIPQHSFGTKQYQPQSPSQPIQYTGSLSGNSFNGNIQQFQNNIVPAQQPQQKLPSLQQYQPFQPERQTQKTFPVVQQHQTHHHLAQEHPQHEQSQFQNPSNQGLPVPQIPFPTIQSTPALPQYVEPNSNFHQPQYSPQQQFQTIPHQTHISPDQEYKQKLIQKHEQFVQKQYEKSQNKVKQLHEDFLQKQQVNKYIIPAIPNRQQYVSENQFPHRSRPVLPTELDQFSNALKKYNDEHPTTTTTTTTTTTERPSSTFRSVASRNIYDQVKAELGKYGTKTNSGKGKPIKTIARDDLLKQLKAALAETPQKLLENKTYDEMDLVLSNGQRVQVIRTTDPNLIKGQQSFSQDQLQELLSKDKNGKSTGLENVAPHTVKDLILPNGQKVQILRAPNPDDIAGVQSVPEGVDLSSIASLYGSKTNSVASNSITSSAVIQSDEPPSLEELAKRGLIPEGYEIEGLSSKPKPKPVQIPKKKATYVYLEEQSDGSFKIQGVKANGEKETKHSGAEVENILDRIRNGEIKLPPSVQRLTLPNDEIVEIESGRIVQRPSTTTTYRPPLTSASTTTVTTPFAPTYTPNYYSQRKQEYTPSPYSTTISPPLLHRSSTVYSQDSPTTYRSTTNSPIYSPSTAAYISQTSHVPAMERLGSSATIEQQHAQESENVVAAASIEPQTVSLNPSEDLIQILKSNSLFAMAKYLKQSGLDTILNETGPYTIFVPTDKAFKNLLIQLGGPERAEEKFKSSPRLLSGLLLHHVIPGSFEIDSLQDEMTGVSLAGTQLRVNQYVMHDQEWNDVLLTTINGAMVVPDKKDIKIPQGIAHAVDRVMFPLPVGDLLQTLQSDRENRFSTFLKILYTSGLSDKLQSKGIKTYTVFAPTDKGFRDVESDVLEKLVTDKEAAEEFAMKHIVSGTLFSAGMRFYQVKDSLYTGKTVILQKTSSGKIKVNDSQMITSNIPATNGVIHALDEVLS